jgi:hypothetical protein
MKGVIELVQQHTLTGERRTFRWKNVVVNNAREQLARLLAGDGLTLKHIDRLAFGTDGTAATATDTSITGAVTVATAVSYPDDSSVMFTATLPSGTGNGTVFQEMGLLFVDNTLATRRAFDSMTKSSLWAWTVTWTISWV